MELPNRLSIGKRQQMLRERRAKELARLRQERKAKQVKEKAGK